MKNFRSTKCFFAYECVYFGGGNALSDLRRPGTRKQPCNLPWKTQKLIICETYGSRPFPWNAESITKEILTSFPRSPFTVYGSSRSKYVLLAFGYATRSVIVRNQAMIDKNFSIWGNAVFIIFKNSPKFEYREFVSAIYAKRKFDPFSSTSIWRKYLCKISLIRENALIESPFLISFNVKSQKILVYFCTSVLAYENRGIFLTFHCRKRRA